MRQGIISIDNLTHVLIYLTHSHFDLAQNFKPLPKPKFVCRIWPQIEDGSTALYIACFNGHDRVANLLLESGADVESGNLRGWRPLHIVSARGHTRLAANLVFREEETERSLNLAPS